MTAGWAYSTVGSQFEVQLGKMLDAARNEGELKPFIGNRAVQWGRIDANASGQVPMSRLDMQRFRLREGDLLVCEGGEVGRAAIWRDQLPECYFQKALHRLRPRRGYDVRLMQALLEYWASVDGFRDYVTQTSIAHLPREKFVTIPLPLPSTHEQRRIGDVLELVDNLIAALERLIAKKQSIKQGMMQQLLTGRTRLPGFVAEWEVAPFKEIALPSPERLDPQTSGNGTLLIELDDIEPGTGRLLRRETVEEAVSMKSVFRTGDVLFGKLRAYLRKFWLADSSGLCSTEIWVLRTQGHHSPKFIRYLVESDSFIEMASNAHGTHMPRADWSLLSRFEIAIPPPDEQLAIANVLLDADLEIEVLQRRLEKARDIKTGMMQQLLTGRVRLPVDVES